MRAATYEYPLLKSQGTQITDAVIARLREVDPADGHLTDVGERVYVGHFDPAGPEPEYPCALVRTLSDSPVQTQRNAISRTRTIAVEAYASASDSDYESVLDSLAEDIIWALNPRRPVWQDTPAIEITLLGGDYAHPEPGSSIASVQYQITITYVTKRTTP